MMNREENKGVHLRVTAYLIVLVRIQSLNLMGTTTIIINMAIITIILTIIIVIIIETILTIGETIITIIVIIEGMITIDTMMTGIGITFLLLIRDFLFFSFHFYFYLPLRNQRDPLKEKMFNFDNSLLVNYNIKPNVKPEFTILPSPSRELERYRVISKLFQYYTSEIRGNYFVYSFLMIDS